jgi:hypothetical protein
MPDTSESQDTPDPTPLREEVEQELDDFVEDTAEEERERMAERGEHGIDEPSDGVEPPA